MVKWCRLSHPPLLNNRALIDIIYKGVNNRVIMASRISWIEAIPEDAREELIHDLSENKKSDLVPLQINDNVYWIPMEVNMLITALEEQEVQDLDPLQS